MDEINSQQQVANSENPPKRRRIWDSFSILTHILVIIILLGVLFYFLNKDYFNKPLPKIQDIISFKKSEDKTASDNIDNKPVVSKESDSEGIIQYDTKPRLGDFSGIVASASVSYNTQNSNNIKVLTPVNQPKPVARVAGVRTTRYNNYRFGDIQTGEYKIRPGDTLWEIAEGAYGRGHYWIKIVEENGIALNSNNQPQFTNGQVINIPKL